MNANFKRWNLLPWLLLLAIGSVGMYVSAQPEEPVIKVIARKFEYTPNVIHLQKNVPVVLEFTSEDVVMGFNVPELKIRTDIVPGKVSRLHIVSDKVGRFAFVCDIFCGSGHEDMTGAIVVSD